MKDSKIEWCDHTFNPWEGCTKVSPGCANCYAEARNKRWSAGANWGPGAPRRRTSEANWRQPLKWNKVTADEFEGWERYKTLTTGFPPRRPRVFCASLADWLDDEVPIEWLADLLDLIRRTRNLFWLLLTKRPENWRTRIVAAAAWATMNGRDDLRVWLLNWVNTEIAPENIALGVTVEDQPRATKRIRALLWIPARVRFLSCEPLLGPVDLTEVTTYQCGSNYNRVNALRGHETECSPGFRGLRTEAGGSKEPRVHWVICGGESGPNARPMHPDWARSLRDQCQAAGVPFFFKQWGEWEPTQSRDEYTERAPLRCMKTSGELSWWAGNEDTTTNYSENYRETDQPIERVGKNAAGRLLDGREHSEFPEVQP
jgi:protein gp37